MLLLLGGTQRSLWLNTTRGSGSGGGAAGAVVAKDSGVVQFWNLNVGS